MSPKDINSSYYLLGDDIVIFDAGLASNYTAIISSLGVSISEAKTHISSNMYEFAKRWYRDGIEVTGIPVRGYLSVDDHW